MPSRRFRCCSSFHLLSVGNFDGNIDSVFLLQDFYLIVAQFSIYPVRLIMFVCDGRFVFASVQILYL